MKARKQTSARVSSLAAKILNQLPEDAPPGMGVFALGCWVCTIKQLRSVVASALGQDETKGQSKPKRRRARL